MHYMPTQLTNSVKGDLHPASAERSDGSLRSDCWELVCQSVGEELYKKLCLKMNFSPHAHPHNGKRTDIFSKEDSLVIMESYQVFLLFVFNTVARTHLCSQAVQNQVMALYGGKTAFKKYVKAHPDKFFSALNDNFQTCCHPEFLLNERYRNEHTERYAKLWDEIYSEIRSYFGNPDKCTEANNIIIELEGSVSFELLKKAAEEKNARTSERMRDLAERGEHPWQQPEFINAHSERTSERMRDLVARGKHLSQQQEFIEENSKRARALVDIGEHLFQQPEFIEENRKQTRDLVARGEHLFQQPEFIEENRKKRKKKEEQKKEQEDQARHEALQQKKEHVEHARQRKKEQEEQGKQAPKVRGKYKTFDDKMEDLKRFKETHGHANVSIPEDRSLAQFCSIARYARKNLGKGVKLTDERISAFDALGFILTTQEYVTRSFDERINDLEEYKQKHGHINVNRHEDSSLYQFCADVRYSLKQFEKGGTMKLTEERIGKLDALGFKWTH